MKQYYIFVDDEQLGPLSLDEISSKKISKETKVWFEGLDDWKNAGEIEELSKFLISTPPPINSFTSQISPPKLVQKENFQVNSDVHENQKILGLNKNVFYWVLGVLVLIIGIVYFNNLQENNKAILLEQNRQTETYNQQQKEIEEQKKRIAEQEQIEENRRRETLENRYKELKEELTLLSNNLKIAQENLNDVTGFKLLRTSSERNEQINSAQNKIDEIKERIRIDVEEINKITAELGI